MVRTWSTVDVVPQHRYPLMTQAINASICECDVQALNAGDNFEARLEHVALGDVSISRYTSIGQQRAVRTQHHCRVDDADATLLYVPLSAEFTVEQSGRSLYLPRGTAALVSLARPLVGVFQANDGFGQSALQVKIPTSLLIQRELRIREVFNRPLPIERGSGRIMLSLIQEVLDQAQYLVDVRGASALGQALIDAVSSLAAEQHRPGNPTFIQRNSRDLSRERVLECIAANLCDPDLSVATIAARCSMSVRCVHRAFEDSDLTVTGYIREQRLLHCRDELRHPDLTRRTVGEVAYSWGFKDVAHFSRCYKSRFGIAPSLERSC